MLLKMFSKKRSPKNEGVKIPKTHAMKQGLVSALNTKATVSDTKLILLKELSCCTLKNFVRYKIAFKLRKPENDSLLRWKNKELVINHKGTRIVNNGED